MPDVAILDATLKDGSCQDVARELRRLRAARQLDCREVTLEELLAEPIVQKVMARDGVDASAIRQLASQVRERLRLEWRVATHTFH